MSYVLNCPRWMAGDHFLETPQGQRLQCRKRRARRLYLNVEDIEPRAKHSMPSLDKDNFQRQLLHVLIKRRRRSFRGPLALTMSLSTTEKTPTHAHNIAKNLLDLLGRPRGALATRRHSLLYADDSQVQALSVSCRHGQNRPSIFIEARPMGTLYADLELLAHLSAHGRGDGAYDLSDDSLLELRRDWNANADGYRSLFGDQVVDSQLRALTFLDQTKLLAQATLTPHRLAWLSGANPLDLAGAWEEIISTSPLRVFLRELPYIKGSSAEWKHDLDEKLRLFRARWRSRIFPLEVPVNLEVVVKPSSPGQLTCQHDLDNVVRAYIMPRIVKILEPPRDGSRQKPDERGPQTSIKSEFARYEVWRLRPAKEGSSGFVSVAIGTDYVRHGGIIDQIDTILEEWERKIEGAW